MRKEAGVTLVELLVTITVVGTVLGIGVPAFGGLAQDNRLSTATNRLVGALHLTRSEAVRRNARVTLCNSADGEYCATEGGWEQGWIIFVDTGATGQREPDDPLLAVGGPAPDGIVVTGNTPVQRYVSYVGLGSTRQASGGLQMGTITLCAGSTGRQIVISRTGRPRVQHGGCAA
jgi:type IV fimbrial biogenesis protein FimT